MAKSDDNIVTKGLRGLVGKMLVFRQRADKTVVARRPKKSLKPPTPAQEQVKERFREAAFYAKTSTADPLVKADYLAAAKPGQSAFNVAFADFFNAPVVKLIDASAYSGQIGDVLKIRAVDDFKVVSVQITITNSAASTVESGMAVLAPGGVWTYSATALNPQTAGCVITATASDIPGNTGALELEL